MNIANLFAGAVSSMADAGYKASILKYEDEQRRLRENAERQLEEYRHQRNRDEQLADYDILRADKLSDYNMQRADKNADLEKLHKYNEGREKARWTHTEKLAKEKSKKLSLNETVGYDPKSGLPRSRAWAMKHPDYALVGLEVLKAGLKENTPKKLTSAQSDLVLNYVMNDKPEYNEWNPKEKGEKPASFIEYLIQKHPESEGIIRTFYGASSPNIKVQQPASETSMRQSQGTVSPPKKTINSQEELNKVMEIVRLDPEKSLAELKIILDPASFAKVQEAVFNEKASKYQNDMSQDPLKKKSLIDIVKQGSAIQDNSEYVPIQNRWAGQSSRPTGNFIK